MIINSNPFSSYEVYPLPKEPSSKQLIIKEIPVDQELKQDERSILCHLDKNGLMAHLEIKHEKICLT